VVTRQRVVSTAERLLGESLRHRLARVSLFSLGLKATGTVLVFVLSVVLARALGPAEYGTYEYVIAWVMLLLVPAAFGLDKLAVRQLSASSARSDWPEASAFVRWALGIVLSFSLVVALGAAAVAWWGAGGVVSPPLLAFWLGCLVVPLSALTILWESTLRGLQHVIEGQLPIMIVRPVIVIVLVVLAIYALGLPPTALTALTAFLVGAACAALLAFVLMRRRLPAELRQARRVPSGRAESGRAVSGRAVSGRARSWRAWFAAALPMMVMAALYTANSRIGTILVGTITGAEAAGVYALASRGADLVIFTLVAVNTALSPTFAGLWAAGDRERLQRVVTQSARLIFALSAAIAAGLFALAPVFLAIFGESFVVGAPVLRVLLLGQLVNVSMGSVGVLLVMADRERLAMVGFAMGTAVNLVLALALVPSYGALGAAWAATASMVVWNVVLWFFTLRTMGVHATVLGPPRST
jgi:O-antigen/teichoic acid export membrane protein